MRKIRVLQVNKLYSPHIGGIERMVQLIAEGLCHSVDMQVLVCRHKGLGRNETVNDISVHRASSLGMMLSMPIAPSFPFLFKKLSQNADIVHFHTPFPLGDLSCLMAGYKGKVIVNWHSDVLRQKGFLWAYKLLATAFLRRADRVIVADSNIAKNSPLLQPFNEKCVVVPFGIDTRRFQLNDDMRKQAEGIRSKFGSPIVLCVGRLVYYKGVEQVIKSMCEVDAVLLLIGDGPLRLNLEKLVVQLGLTNKVVFLGMLSYDEMPAYFHACDVFVLPSVASTEAFGLVQLEAMACGKPVVNTRLPTGVPEVSRHQETGLTMPPGDAQALGVAIGTLLDDSALRQRYGENAKQRVREHFSLQKMLDSVQAIYGELVGCDIRSGRGTNDE